MSGGGWGCHWGGRAATAKVGGLLRLAMAAEGLGLACGGAARSMHSASCAAAVAWPWSQPGSLATNRASRGGFSHSPKRPPACPATRVSAGLSEAELAGSGPESGAEDVEGGQDDDGSGSESGWSEDEQEEQEGGSGSEEEGAAGPSDSEEEGEGGEELSEGRWRAAHAAHAARAGRRAGHAGSCRQWARPRSKPRASVAARASTGGHRAA